MRFIVRIGGFGMLLWASGLWAQGNNNTPLIIAPPPSYGGTSYSGEYGMGAGTVEGSILQGLAAVIRSQGDYNLSTSAAAVNYSTAVRQGIQNQKDYVEAYFAIRAFNRQARDAELARDRQLTQDWLKFRAPMRPKRLTSSELDPVSGTINWPLLLQSDELTAVRQNVQKAFAERHQLGMMRYNNYREVRQSIAGLLNDLLNHIQTLAPNEYIQAKRFMEALLYEASLPLG